MTDDWDFYALTVDDEPASIFVDLAFSSPLSPLPSQGDSDDRYEHAVGDERA